MGVSRQTVSFFESRLMYVPIIVIIAFIIAAIALFVNRGQNSVVEDTAEAVINEELGLPEGTVNLRKELQNINH